MIRDLMTKIIVKAMIAKGYRDIHDMHSNTIDAQKKNDELLFSILKKNASCEFGRKYGFETIHSIEDFRRQVPLTDYPAYDSYIQRMTMNSEQNVLTSLPVVGYAQSSGSVGRRKYVPATQPTVNTFTKYTVSRSLANADRYAKVHHEHGITAHRGMYTGPAYDDYLPNGLLCSNIPDVAGRQLGFLYPFFISIPFPKLFNSSQIEYHYVNLRTALENRNTLFIFSAFMKDVCDYINYLEQNWRELCDDIEHGTINKEIAHPDDETYKKLLTVLHPMPERANELRREFQKGFDETILKRIWPNLSVISGIGTATFTPFAKILRSYTEGIPFDFGIYGASEGLFAACDSLESSKQLLLVDANYYEFLPYNDGKTDESTILSLNELEIDKEYEIVITNKSGFYRYRCGDVVRVVDYLNECPYIVFSCRKGQLLNLTGEKTTEEQMAATVKRIGKEANYFIGEWAVYYDLSTHPFRYVLLCEGNDSIDFSQYEELAHTSLAENNPRYKYFVDMKKISKIKVYSLKEGTNKAWRQKMADEKGSPITQVKPVRFIDTDEKKNYFLSQILKK